MIISRLRFLCYAILIVLGGATTITLVMLLLQPDPGLAQLVGTLAVAPLVSGLLLAWRAK